MVMCLCSSRYFTLEAEQRFTLVDSVICGVTCIRHASPYPLYSTRTPASSVHQVIALTPNAGEDNQTGMYVPMEGGVLWFKEIHYISTVYRGNEHLNNMKLFIKPGITPSFVSSHF